MPTVVAGRGVEADEESATPLGDAGKDNRDIRGALAHPSQGLDGIEASTDPFQETRIAQATNHLGRGLRGYLRTEPLSDLLD
ncbi:MAG: hypothetical protein M3R49_12610 [Chloroflexota bacterium]|nr:hypothetical protein [Chloroflexota bacterium]